MTPSERIKASDRAVKTLFDSLPPDLRFSGTIRRYLELPNIPGNLEGEEGATIMYARVKNTITELWNDARKDAS